MTRGAGLGVRRGFRAGRALCYGIGLAAGILGCGPGGGFGAMVEAAVPDDPSASLVGAWTRSGSEACAEAYPATLRFDAKGLYRGATEPPGGFTLWDVGTWRVEAPGRVAISTANDAVVTYGFAFEGGDVSFAAPDGCRIRYRKVA